MRALRRLRIPLAPLLFGMLSGVPCARGAAPSVRYVPIDTLAGYTLYPHGAWSASGGLLALRGPRGLAVFDLDRRDATPKTLLVGATRIAWAPDGPWLACWGASSSGYGSVVAVSASSGEVDTLFTGKAAGWPAWSDEGTASFIEQYDEPERILSAAVPSASNRERHGATAAATLVVVADEAHRGLLYRRFDPATGTLSALPELTSPGAGPLFQCTMPDGRTFLMLVWRDDGCAHTSIVDESGRTLVDFGPACGAGGFSGTSASSNGRFVIGNDEVDNEFTSTREQLYLADASAAWIVPVEGAPMGHGAMFSSRDLVFAFDAMDDASGEKVYVGRLEIVPR